MLNELRKELNTLYILTKWCISRLWNKNRDNCGNTVPFYDCRYELLYSHIYIYFFYCFIDFQNSSIWLVLYINMPLVLLCLSYRKENTSCNKRRREAFWRETVKRKRETIVVTLSHFVLYAVNTQELALPVFVFCCPLYCLSGWFCGVCKIRYTLTLCPLTMPPSLPPL